MNYDGLEVDMMNVGNADAILYALILTTTMRLGQGRLVDDCVQ